MNLLVTLYWTSLRTQRCPGESKLVKPTKLKSQNRGSPEFPNQNLSKSVWGFLSYDRTNKQNRDYNFMYRIPSEYFMLAIVCWTRGSPISCFFITPHLTFKTGSPVIVKIKILDQGASHQLCKGPFRLIRFNHERDCSTRGNFMSMAVTGIHWWWWWVGGTPRGFRKKNTEYLMSNEEL